MYDAGEAGQNKEGTRNVHIHKYIYEADSQLEGIRGQRVGE